MAIFAKDQEKIICAWEANPQKTYLCLGCNRPLKYRRSKLQFPHFYHPSKSLCRIEKKNKKHLSIQIAILKQLSQAKLEVPFKTIGRIADVVWEKEKIIFEVQCSPISFEEAKMRVLEYNSLGYHVIWILDDRVFNRRRIRKSEFFMRTHHSYFVQGTDFFYDQQEIIRGRVRSERKNKIPIHLGKTSRQSRSIFPECKREKAPLILRLKRLYKPFFKKILKSKSINGSKRKDRESLQRGEKNPLPE